MKSAVQSDESAALKWCVQIVKRPIGSSSPGGLAHLYAVDFKHLHQTARTLGTAVTVVQPIARKD